MLNRGSMRARWMCRNQMYRRFVQGCCKVRSTYVGGCRKVCARFAGVCVLLWRKNIILIVGRTGEVGLPQAVNQHHACFIRLPAQQDIE